MQTRSHVVGGRNKNHEAGRRGRIEALFGRGFARAARYVALVLTVAVLGCASLSEASSGSSAEGEGSSGASGFVKAPHPFMLWTQADIADLKARIEVDPVSRRAFEKFMSSDEDGPRWLQPLLGILMDADPQLIAQEKGKLLGVVRSPAPRGGGQWINVLRYDILYPHLTDAERTECEEMFRFYIYNTVVNNAVFDPKLYNDERNYSRYDARRYTKTNWLPNIILPRKLSANLMALALRDEKLIRETWAAYGSWKWYFDSYLSDIGFYHEEFSKMGATPGSMIIYCIAAERLGLNELGLGYEGENGATMRGHIQSVIHMGYPMVITHSERPHYPKITMGDLREGGSSRSGDVPTPAFQHSIVQGYIGDLGGENRWQAHGAWGGERRGNLPQWDGYSNFTPKMQIPLWFEFGHARWPEDGYAYFLTHMRDRGEPVYLPSPLFGIEPIAPASVEAPPAPSNVWPARGMVMLRAESSPAYWEGPWPAVSMRLGTAYAHSVNDAFALMGFFAHNRPIYLNRQTWPGYAKGWSRSAQSHAGLIVDGKESGTTDATTTRQQFGENAKMVVASSDGIYEGVTYTRSLVLTKQYLLETTEAQSAQPRRYDWLVHALGVVRESEGGDAGWTAGDWPDRLEALSNVRRHEAGDQPWGVVIEQRFAGEDPAKAELPDVWYERRIGVQVRMLGDGATTAFTADTPNLIQSYRDENGQRQQREVPSEVGGVTVLASREAEATAFVVLHEPYAGGQPAATRFEAMSSSPGVTAVRIMGESSDAFRTRVNDRVLVNLRDGESVTTVSDDGEMIKFIGQAFVRIEPKRIVIEGDVRQLKVDAPGRRAVWLNGRRSADWVAVDGMLMPSDARE